MDELFEPNKPSAARLDLHSIFTKNKGACANEVVNDFVPFYQERDQLGRLISRDQNRNRYVSLKQLSSKNSRRTSIQIPLNQRSQSSDKTVQKMFKLNNIRKVSSSRSILKLKIALPAVKTVTPELGYYNTAQITNKIKVNKGNLIQFKNTKLPLGIIKKQKQISEILDNKLGFQSEKKIKDDQIHIHQKIQLNPNLPELQNFHRMQKLQMQIKENFENDHLRFKDLMRSSLVLANKIKRQLELD